MIRKEIQVVNRLGIHARPAGLIVDITGRAKSDIFIEYDGTRANAKSILNILGAGIRQGATITLLVEGEDEAETLADLVRLIEQLSE